MLTGSMKITVKYQLFPETSFSSSAKKSHIFIKSKLLIHNNLKWFLCKCLSSTFSGDWLQLVLARVLNLAVKCQSLHKHYNSRQYSRGYTDVSRLLVRLHKCFSCFKTTPPTTHRSSVLTGTDFIIRKVSLHITSLQHKHREEHFINNITSWHWC